MLPDGALKDKSIIVTGGGSGLGLAMTKCFLQLGANVTITSRSEDRLTGAAAKLKEETGNEPHIVGCDVREPEQVEALLASAVAKFGKVDVLVNNAAGNFIKK